MDLYISYAIILFLSGYVFSIKSDFKVFIKKKCKSILIPYFALGIVMIVFQIIFDYVINKCFNLNTCTILFVNLLIQRRFWTLWFIACLFWMEIIFYILVKKCKNMRVLFGVVCTMLLLGLFYYHIGGVALPWNIDVVLTASIFFFAGYWLKCNKEKIHKLINRRNSGLFFLILASCNVIFGYLGTKISGRGMEMFGSSYGFPLFAFISAFAGIFCVIIFSNWFYIKSIEYIGRNSMVYYAWHQTIIIPIVYEMIKVLKIPVISNRYMLWGEWLVETIIIVLILTFCNAFISNTKLKFMVGK